MTPSRAISRTDSNFLICCHDISYARLTFKAWLEYNGERATEKIPNQFDGTQ